MKFFKRPFAALCIVLKHTYKLVAYISAISSVDYPRERRWLKLVIKLNMKNAINGRKTDVYTCINILFRSGTNSLQHISNPFCHMSAVPTSQTLQLRTIFICLFATPNFVQRITNNRVILGTNCFI